jgi:hypothetical protein
MRASQFIYDRQTMAREEVVVFQVNMYGYGYLQELEEQVRPHYYVISKVYFK